MKFTYKKILFAVTALFIIALIPFIQSCSNNNELEGTEKIQSSVELTASEKTEIINSTEFKEFVDANIEIAALVKSLKESQKTSSKVKSETQRTTSEGKSYKSYPCKYDYVKVQHMISKINAFNERFPSIKKVSSKTIINLMSETVAKSIEFQKQMLTRGLISQKKSQNVRQKLPPNESTNESAYIATYNSANEAFSSATLYSFTVEKECTGFILSDGTFVVFFDPGATYTTSSYPTFQFQCKDGVGFAYYQGKQIVGTFHTHPNNAYWGGQDPIGQTNYFQDYPGTILYNGNAYTFTYNNGYNIGLTDISPIQF